MHYHHQNLTDGRLPLWRHGRAWFGRFAWEWSIFMRSPSLGASIGRGGMMIRGGFFAFYLSWTRRESGCFGPRWEICWLDGAIRIETPWMRQWEFLSSDPWWRKAIHLRVVEWVLGRWRCTTTKGSPTIVFIPMPEGCYPAWAIMESRTWRRRFGLRRHDDSVWLDIPGGIPHAGKGTTCYNCGDDGLYGIGGSTVEKAIARAVETVLTSRRRYGYDSKDTGREPAVVRTSPAKMEESQCPQP